MAEERDSLSGTGASPLPDEPIVFANLWKVYGRKLAVAGLDLTVRKGEVVALLGRNGAGKTSAIKALLGHARIDHGRALLCGHESTALPPVVRRRVGYMAEGNHLDPWRTVAGLVRFTSSFYPRWNHAIAARLLNDFGLPPDQKVGRLSNGQRGQLALALALGPDPDVLVLDDPMLGLDAVVRSEFFGTIAEVLSSRERAVLFTSHILPDVERIADRIFILADGQVIAAGTLAELARRVRRFNLRLPEKVTLPPGLPGLLSSRADGRGSIVVVTDDAPLRALQPEAMEESPMNLEEIFIALTGSRLSRRLFS